MSLHVTVRSVAYQKNVVMKYLDNLIAWGDMLFQRDSIESTNEAALLYMLAYEILGKRPVKVPHVQHEELTYNELEAEYINRNRREFEITKHISLAQMAPLSLLMLKETGQTTISLPKWLFDMDYPDHYMRRIKNVSLSSHSPTL